mmetsp:Transcript_10018/g.30602  ORF Transcript_10018/g.30602 Transcript_10018/m.30602 type:complete len:212 (-) Transcript_10018:1329-1964(-)|eukprot:CAMPEP_0198731972 /NCGR_PEP_ID=MMETSP1475-20131203/33094_1 /TAXON_ID= ORGANISM="Unidentified sp., Strain CCMP1999" /NCGR_SAMPLE_ID=MMETSP1475 /ASSEMBLY_ACC=CAM_ASM_001111 /LENGTH=211 /DNA_ID=CAMNT_0044495001 /DNA_START=86 /DNA_END=721 /DNA_ORIENTATION=+
MKHFARKFPTTRVASDEAESDMPREQSSKSMGRLMVPEIMRLKNRFNRIEPKEMEEISQRNFSPSFLQLAERKFYLYARKSAQGTFVINARQLPQLLRELKQAEWFVQMVDKEVRESHREFIRYHELLMVLNYMIELPEEEIMEAFATFDKDGSQQLSCGELKRVLCEQGKYPLSEAEVERLFKLVDTDNSGQISLSEFVTMWHLGKQSIL